MRISSASETMPISAPPVTGFVAQPPSAESATASAAQARHELFITLESPRIPQDGSDSSPDRAAPFGGLPRRAPRVREHAGAVADVRAAILRGLRTQPGTHPRAPARPLRAG